MVINMIVFKILVNIKELGTTIDDELGEAFDKIIVFRNNVPGGPQIEILAKKGDQKINEQNVFSIKEDAVFLLQVLKLLY